jgi:NADH-quinone oxidoreductase subunit L
MTTPLVVLAIFAIAYGWVGIPEDFMNLHLSPSWFHEFVGSTLAEMPKAAAFSWVPFGTSLLVALGGLSLGWLVYRNVNAPAEDKLQIPRLKNKYYFDEMYDATFIRFFTWFSEVAVVWVDKQLIDGVLHFIAHATGVIGAAIRTWIDVYIVNKFGDVIGYGTKDIGKGMTPMQTGRIQQYMMAAMLALILVGAILYYVLITA